MIPHLTRSSPHRVFSATACRRCRTWKMAKASNASSLSNRLLPHRHSRGPHRRRPALSPGRYRSHLEVRLHRVARESHTKPVAADFLQNPIKALPYKVHTVLTDNGTHFTDPAGGSWTAADIKQKIERKEPFLGECFCRGLRPQRYRTSPHQAQTSLGQAFPLRDSRRSPQPPLRLRQRLQIRQSDSKLSKPSHRSSSSAGPGQMSQN